MIERERERERELNEFNMYFKTMGSSQFRGSFRAIEVNPFIKIV